MNKTKIIAYGLALALTSTVAFVTSPKTNADFDLNGLNAQVQNHEARITNNEKDIKTLQDNTGTAPAADKVAVPTYTGDGTNQTPATTTAPAPTPAPAPVTSPAPAPTETTTPPADTSSPWSSNNVFIEEPACGAGCHH